MRKLGHVKYICYWHTAERKESMVHCDLSVNYFKEKGYG